eukprot:6201093-Pleurochrysis_carterae.AAC.3
MPTDLHSACAPQRNQPAQPQMSSAHSLRFCVPPAHKHQTHRDVGVPIRRIDARVQGGQKQAHRTLRNVAELRNSSSVRRSATPPRASRAAICGERLTRAKCSCVSWSSVRSKLTGRPFFASMQAGSSPSSPYLNCTKFASAFRTDPSYSTWMTAGAWGAWARWRIGVWACGRLGGWAGEGSGRWTGGRMGGRAGKLAGG